MVVNLIISLFNLNKFYDLESILIKLKYGWGLPRKTSSSEIEFSLFDMDPPVLVLGRMTDPIIFPIFVKNNLWLLLCNENARDLPRGLRHATHASAPKSTALTPKTKCLW